MLIVATVSCETDEDVNLVPISDFASFESGYGISI